MEFQCLALAVPIRLQNETTCTRDIFPPRAKVVNSKLNVLVQTTPQRLVKNSFQMYMYRTGACPESPRSKFTIVCLRDQLTIPCSSEFTWTNCITELNRAADVSRTKNETVNSLCYYQVWYRYYWSGSVITWMIICRKSTAFISKLPGFLPPIFDEIAWEGG